ncbi:MAG: 3-hydroxyisobutyrate dehydrogenase [Chloroflexi bacterium]|jgi:3-hydroxyisobutyrate dehydrogenase|nr:3-hydroxyisobutyrate dehydrogenase [Chloroflexota bacterium]|tara:strand:- start:14 stop:919 length:906 start_codon:yes stop_codon:yes gene_type:complete
MQVGFIGTGNIGTPMALQLINKGFDLYVNDINFSAAEFLIDRGAVWANSPKDLSEKVDVICACLPGPMEAKEVVFGENGIINSIKPGTIFIDHTTNSIEVIKDIAIQLNNKGVGVLDAPVSGGVEGAKTRDLTLLVGGDLSILNNARPVLDAMGKTVLHVGAVGSGNICKLMHNCANFSLSLATIQCLNVAVKAGLDPSVVIEVFQKSALGKNFDLQVRLPETLFKGDFEPRFSLKLANKDLNLAIELAASLGMDFSMAETCQIDMLKAVEKGWSDMDSSIFLTLQEEKSGVLLRHNNNQK